jgi:hypothetical protein
MRASGLKTALKRTMGICALVFAIVAFAGSSEARRLRFGATTMGGGATMVVRVHELPRIPELQLPDGRYVDIGMMKGGSKDSTLVGYVGSQREYLNLPLDTMTDLVRIAGFDDVTAFKRQIAERQKSTDVKAVAMANRARTQKTHEQNDPTQSDVTVANATSRTTKAPLLSDAAIDSILMSAIAMAPLLLIGFGSFKIYRWINPPVGGKANAGPAVSKATAISRLGRSGRAMEQAQASDHPDAKQPGANQGSRAPRVVKTGNAAFGRG